MASTRSSTRAGTLMRYVFGIALALAGVNHFVHPAGYVRIVPPWLPAPELLVVVSGVAEVVIGVLILIPRFVRLAAWGAIALLVAVFPANIHMALHPDLYPDIPSTLLWVRLPFQVVFIAWAYRYTRPPSREATDRHG